MKKRLISIILALCMTFAVLPMTLSVAVQAANQTYTFNFDSKGGTPVPSITVTEGMLIPEPTPPTKPGFTFGGWYKSSDTKYNKWDFSKDTFIPNFYSTLYARWDYVVTFESNGGTPIASIACLPNEKIMWPGDPKREGYDFKGWFTDPEFKNSWSFSNSVTGNLTLYAKWHARLNTVEFLRIDPVAGNTTYWKTQVATDSLFPVPTVPKKDGYTFDGWYKDFALTTRFNFAVDTTSKDMKLYDSWKPNNYTVTFDAQNGTPIQSYTGSYSGLIPEPAKPQKAGYIFGGWWWDGMQAPCDFSSYRLSSDINFYAKWLTSDNVTVTFNTRGGSAISPVTIKYGSKISVPTPPQKSGYVFDGWYEGDVDSNLWDFGTKIYNNITLNAKWHQSQPPASPSSVYANNLAIFEQIRTDTYGLAYYATTGDYEDDDEEIIIPKEIVSKTKEIIANHKDDYSKIQAISNWVSDNISYDYDVYYGRANTSQDPKTVFKLRRGVCDGYTQLHVSMLRAAGIPAVYIFGKAGSNWEAHAWSQAYLRSQDRWVIIDTTFNSTAKTRRYFDISLQNISSDHRYTGADIKPATVNFIYNSIYNVVEIKDPKQYRNKLKEPEKPTRNGYTFVGWYKTSNPSPDAVPWNFNTDIVIGDTYLFAVWKMNDVTVSFNTNGGSPVESITAPYGTIHRTLPTPTKFGYTFGGWYYDANFTYAVSLTTAFGNNVTLHAKWIKSAIVPDGWYHIGINGSYLNINDSGKGEIRNSAYPQLFYIKYVSDDQYTIQSTDDSYVGNDKTITNGLQIKSVANSYKWKITGDNDNSLVIRSVSKSDYFLVTSGGKTADGTAIVFSNSDTIGAHSQFKFIPLTATVTFDSRGGNNVEALTVFRNLGNVIKKPTDPTRKGYTFAGWYSDSALTQAVTFPYTVVDNTTLYAKWNADSYLLTFYSNPGNAVSSQTISSGGKATKPSSPTLNGNIFGGWYKDSNYRSEWNFDTDKVTTDTTLYARWINFNYPGLPFADVKGKWYEPYVSVVYQVGLMTGMSRTEFGGDISLTRAMFVTVLANLDKTFNRTNYTTSDFSDVKTGDWYLPYVAWAAEKKLVSGIGNGLYGHDVQITREQMALIIFNFAKYLKLNTESGADLSSYSDANQISNWAQEAIKWAVASGLISGTSDTTMSPQSTATRGQVAVIFTKFITLNES